MKKWIVTTVGFGLVVLGIVMLVLPGPGLLAIGGGLAILASRYGWARKLLGKVRHRLQPGRPGAGRGGVRSR
ncbi:MAG: hypothetical protein D6773_14965 [Alphaproteobacteria bacterium]|nr:MAG: hypothetical protein D6773_14965 [Alphaproteobacteria bacterium]